MPRFNSSVPFTQEWKDAILAAIKNRKKNPVVSAEDCAACTLSKTITNSNLIACERCPIGDTADKINTWCYGYVRGRIHCNKKLRFQSEKERLAYLDKMEAAVRRRKVVKP